MTPSDSSNNTILIWQIDVLKTLSAVKETYMKKMMAWELCCIEIHIQCFQNLHKEWLAHQKKVIEFMKENQTKLVNQRWHVRNTMFTGTTLGFVSTGLAVATVGTLWFPPVSLGLGIASGAVGGVGAVMNLGKIYIYKHTCMHHAYIQCI